MLIDDRYENNEEFKIPASKPDKYEMLLNFYKKLFTENPNLKQNLKLEYEITIKGLFALEEEDIDEILAPLPLAKRRVIKKRIQEQGTGIPMTSLHLGV